MRNTFSSLSNRGEIAARNCSKGLATTVASVLLAICGLVAPSPAASAANQLTLSWQNNDSTADGFKIERSSSGGNYTQIAQLSSSQTSYLDSGLTSGATYYYRVRSYNSAGNSDYSNVASGSVPSSSTTTPPSNPQLTTNSLGQVDVSWSSVAGATGYTVERASSFTGPWTQIADVNGSSATSYHDTSSLWDNQTYFYRMRAYNASGSSDYSGTTSTTTPADPSLLAHWRFDESSGIIAMDWSGNKNYGHMANPIRATGISGRALDFNGTNVHMLVLDSATLNPVNAITVAVWIAPNSWNDVPRILQKGVGSDQYRLFARDGSLRFSLAGINLDVPVPEPGFWYHIAGSYDGSTMKLFIDGQLAAQQAVSLSMPTYTGPLSIGVKTGSTNPGHHFDGGMDDLRIYGRALTDAEIQNLATP